MTPGKKTEPTGSVLVIGGGIAGVQASLDLAESGQKVYLAERSPAIGGNMARLDKTFPTNDCSMCILSPKIVECGRHRNIELMTLSEIDRMEGDAGHFSVELLEHARYVDPVKCTGCGACLEQCPARNVLNIDSLEKPIEIEEEFKTVIDGLIDEHGSSRSAVMRIMQEMNERLRYLPASGLKYLAHCLGLPISVLYRIATFYAAFSFEKRGLHTVSVCTGTACHIKGAPRLMDELKRELGVDVGGTSTDGLFTLEAVRCLGCCSLAPVIKIDDRVYGGVTPSQVPKILGEYRS